MSHPEVDGRISRGIAWTSVGAGGVAALDILATVVLFRVFVSRTELGVATLAASLFPLLDIIVDLGLAAAVTQSEEADDARVSTAFWVNAGMTVAVIALLAVGGPAIAALHDQPIVAYLLLAYGGKLVLLNAWAIPVALMKRQLRFREVAIVRVLASAADVVAKIGVAAAGFPIWSFVAGPLAYAVVCAIATQLYNPWRPRFVFDAGHARAFLRFGLRSSASQLLLLFYASVDYQVVGKFFGEAALGLYRIAYDLVLYTVKFVGDVVVSVAFPTFARLRTADRSALPPVFLAFSRQSVAMNLPALVVVLVAAEEVLAVVFPAYAAAAPAVRIFCLVGMLRAMSMVFPPLLDGLGRPQATLRYALFLIIWMPALYVGFAVFLGDRFGMLSVAYAWLAGYPVAFAFVAAMGLAATGLPLSRYLRAVTGVLACGAVAIGVGFATRMFVPFASPGLRLAAIAALSIGVLSILLARWQGLALGSVWRALKQPKAAPPAPTGPPGDQNRMP